MNSVNVTFEVTVAYRDRMLRRQTMKCTVLVPVPVSFGKMGVEAFDDRILVTRAVRFAVARLLDVPEHEVTLEQLFLHLRQAKLALLTVVYSL